jgi:hypothetical protein
VTCTLLPRIELTINVTTILEIDYSSFLSKTSFRCKEGKCHARLVPLKRISLDQRTPGK